MKQINGTITLSFLEEDNQQRVIFRVVPLCTREGVVFREKSVDFPDQGSLRIVPDKREQSTFKERMRSMGSLCAIHLCSDGKELAKVRQNRNYDPGQGECNQFAIYSDVICEFAEDGIFEVFSEGADYSRALASHVLLRRGQVLYGPVECPEQADWTTLRPFGNDSYLLHTVLMNNGEERAFYWNPELTVSWRQRRGTLRRGKPRSEDDAEESETEAEAETETASAAPLRTETLKAAPQAAQPTEEKPVAKAQATQTVPAPQPQEAAPLASRTGNRAPVERIAPERAVQAEPPRVAAQPLKAEPILRVSRVERRQEPELETSLPIGKRLSILDGNISFDEQISKLDQPLSMDANLLSRSQTPDRPENVAAGVRFSGTPLVRAGVKAPQPIRPGEALHYVVEKQIRSAHREQTERTTDFHPVENPIENLHLALEKIWQSSEIRQQAMQSLCENETFMQTFLHYMQMQGREMKAVEAAQEQLEEIEAERLSLLMQLETAKTDYKHAMETMFAELSQKKREALNQLDHQISALKTERDQLAKAVESMGDSAQQHTLQWMLENDLQLCVCNGEMIALAPTVGVKRTSAEMVAAIRAAMNRRGFACNEDDATELLLHFALNDELCLCGETLSEAELCAHALLDGLGLLGVTARTQGNTHLQVASLLPGNGMRTPTVEVCTLGRAAIHPYGHKTIRLLEARSPLQGDMPLPVVYTPVFQPGMRDASQHEPIRPTALASFEALRAEAKPMMDQGEAWFEALEARLCEQSSILTGVTTQQMRVFVGAATGKLRGGFLAAADAAVLGWLIPEVYRCALNPEPLRQEIGSLPRCLAALGIR